MNPDILPVTFWRSPNITMKAIVLSAVCFECSCRYEIVILRQRMPHFNKVSTLLDLSLTGLERLLREGALTCSEALVSVSKDEVAVGLRTRQMMEDLVMELSSWLFGHVAPSLHDIVTKHIIKVSKLSFNIMPK